MRRLLLILFLLALPLQFTWGAAARYCSHETVDSVSHFGHHSHVHQTAVSDSAEPLASGDDTDCGYCHLACAQPLICTNASVSLRTESAYILPTPGLNRFRVPDVIDRPNWSLAI
ncbi:MAG: DUF2946 family protein [Gammaproteobacteria bacterium]|nr:DUF2946 family protein [Gammaproteobacteria bacterium]MBU0786596.1 DUF2946 family protein [Gammaproteobacteria bacterium]MBU0814333.1 DUF2946 family protein [Gammaproteobacteria bacterium]MBU1786147.1 DUF2946 family protein [Gammaproteobacteria bacterium]